MQLYSLIVLQTCIFREGVVRPCKVSIKNSHMSPSSSQVGVRGIIIFDAILVNMLN